MSNPHSLVPRFKNLRERVYPRSNKELFALGLTELVVMSHMARNSIAIDNMDDRMARIARKNKLFKRIEADIKERDKRKKPGRDELYIDRDRLIAVNMGESDIREIMFKQKIFASPNLNMNHEEEEEESYKILVQQAEFELNRFASHRALAYLNRAVMILPEDPVSLLLRGSAYVGVQDFDLALKDADKVLELTPCSRAFLVKGEALYHLGDFEHALVFYHRALVHKTTIKEEESIRFGITRAEKAIDNAVGLGAVDHFTEMRYLIKKVPQTVLELNWCELQNMHRKQRIKKPKVNNIFANHKKYFPMELTEDDSSFNSKKEKKYQRKLLGELSKDLEYMEVLANEVSKHAVHRYQGNKSNGDVVRSEAEDAVAFLRERQEFWRQFQPRYFDAKQKNIKKV